MKNLYCVEYEEPSRATVDLVLWFQVFNMVCMGGKRFNNLSAR